MAQTKLIVLNTVENHFEKNTIRCKKLATIISVRKNVARPFVKRKQVSTSAEILQQRLKSFSIRAVSYNFDESVIKCEMFFKNEQTI